MVFARTSPRREKPLLGGAFSHVFVHMALACARKLAICSTRAKPKHRMAYARKCNRQIRGSYRLFAAVARRRLPPSFARR